MTTNTYRISGKSVARLAARDGLTVQRDGDLLVHHVGWTGPAEGRNVLDYFRGALCGAALSGATYLGPDADGVEPTWEDAR